MKETLKELLKGNLKKLLKGSLKEFLQGNLQDCLKGTLKERLKGNFKELLKGNLRELLKGNLKELSKGNFKGTFERKFSWGICGGGGVVQRNASANKRGRRTPFTPPPGAQGRGARADENIQHQSRLGTREGHKDPINKIK